MRLAFCAPPPGLRYDALVDAPVTAIASPMLKEVRAAAGEAWIEPLWCAYWDQSEELGPYYLHERITDAWYRVLVEGPYDGVARVAGEGAAATGRVERVHPVSRVRFVGRWGRGASAPVLRARSARRLRSRGSSVPVLVPNENATAVIGSRQIVRRFEQP